jgi:hypothetical protein
MDVLAAADRPSHRCFRETRFVERCRLRDDDCFAYLSDVNRSTAYARTTYRSLQIMQRTRVNRSFESHNLFTGSLYFASNLHAPKSDENNVSTNSNRSACIRSRARTVRGRRSATVCASVARTRAPRRPCAHIIGDSRIESKIQNRIFPVQVQNDCCDGWNERRAWLRSHQLTHCSTLASTRGCSANDHLRISSSSSRI